MFICVCPCVLHFFCLTFLGTKMALKFVTKNKTKLKSFLREYSLTGSLSCSPFIIKVLDVLFETEDSYVFGQEYAPAGDLFDIIPPQVKLSSFLPPITVLTQPELLQSVAMFTQGGFNKLSWDRSLVFVLIFSLCRALTLLQCYSSWCAGKARLQGSSKGSLKMAAAKLKMEILLFQFSFLELLFFNSI